MANKEDSSFLQGVESRLDALFGEDSGAPVRDKDPVVPEPAIRDIPAPTKSALELKDDVRETPLVPDVHAKADVVSELKEDIREIPIVKAPELEPALAADKTQTPDKSTFISEIEKRFSAIFGEDEKEAAPDKIPEKPAAALQVESPVKPAVSVETPLMQAAEPATDLKIQASESAPVDLTPTPAVKAAAQEPLHEEPVLTDFVPPVSSIYNSPLKDMKSIVLSIEWEISDHILEQFDEEINKLYLLYTGNRIIQGFLRILRFLGRYIRVRGVSSNQDSINLLLSVYDHLESVMISEGMTEARKHIILIDNIKKYRSWVETTDIETGAASVMSKQKTEEVKAPAERFAEIVQPAIEIPPLATPPAETASASADTAIPLRLELEKRDEEIQAIKEPDILLPSQPAIEDQPVLSLQTQKAIMETMKNMPADEAVQYAVEKIKNIYQTELDTLKEEIRILKIAR